MIEQKEYSSLLTEQINELRSNQQEYLSASTTKIDFQQQIKQLQEQLEENQKEKTELSTSLEK